MPDLGAARAAEVLAGRLGFAMTADGVEELARRGLLPVTGYFKDHPLYDGRALETFTDHVAAASAAWAGQLRTAGQAAAYLKIRRSNLVHLTRPGVSGRPGTGAPHGIGAGRPACRCTGPGDLDALAARPDIDWAAVRATPPRHRSPLAAVEQAENILTALADKPPAARRRRRR